jgi:thiosulfate dehydrogenase [quinone] large subunit
MPSTRTPLRDTRQRSARNDHSGIHAPAERTTAALAARDARPEPAAALALQPRDLHLGYAALRVALGVNIAMHGISRLGDLPAFVESVVGGFQGTFLPPVLVRAFAWTISPIEALVGTLLVLGLWTRAALMAGAALLVALTFGVTLQQRWEVAGLQLVYVIAYAALLASAALNRYSLDEMGARPGW